MVTHHINPTTIHNNPDIRGSETHPVTAPSLQTALFVVALGKEDFYSCGQFQHFLNDIVRWQNLVSSQNNYIWVTWYSFGSQMLSALQRASSLPSLQSRRPSQTRDLNDEDEDFADDDDDYDYLSIHWPLLHVASVTAQAEGGRAVAAAPWEGFFC